MTAEIAILNQEAVALAADSAVTVGGGQNVPKIYPSANKVFMLSKFHPVGIMIYSSANFLGIHWETIIKTYRKELQDNKFATLPEYSTHFLEFIENNRMLFPESEQIEHNKFPIFKIFEEIKETFYTSIVEKIKDPENINLEEFTTILNNIIDDNYDRLKSLNNIVLLDGSKLSADEIKEIHRKFSQTIKKIKKDSFTGLPLAPQASRKLTLIGKLALTKLMSSGAFTGIVIAGYGEEDVFPSLQSFGLESIICNKLKYFKSNDDKISFENRAEIIPFAQSDMVHTFVEGVDPDYQNIINDQIASTFIAFFDSISNDILNLDEDSELRPQLQAACRKSYFRLLKEFQKTRHDKFIRPLIDIVVSLPKIELANMAEAMVNLTSFRRKMSKTMETVGGPIDVALISKGDGFVWINRKHYFSPELNHHFFQNYFRGLENETK